MLRSILNTRKEQLFAVIASLVPGATDATIDPLCDFLLDFYEVQSPHRTIRLGANDLAVVLMWRKQAPAGFAGKTPSPVPGVAEPMNAAAANASAMDTDSAAATSSNAAATQPHHHHHHHPIRRLLDEASDKNNLSAKVQSKLCQLLALLDQSNLPDGPAGACAAALSELAEPAWQQADGIVQQFAARPIFRVVDETHASAVNVAECWSDADADVGAADAEPADADVKQLLVVCDMVEVMKSCLQAASGPGIVAGASSATSATASIIAPTTGGSVAQQQSSAGLAASAAASASGGGGGETNLANDCKRLLHLSASPQSVRDRTQTATCFRTRRVDLEQGAAAGSAARPDKKIYGECSF